MHLMQDHVVNCLRLLHFIYTCYSRHAMVSSTLVQLSRLQQAARVHVALNMIFLWYIKQI